MVPPAALCIHLCIGQAYAFSVFNLPMTKLIGIAKSAPGRLEAHRSRLDILDRHLLPRRFRRGVRPLGRGGRAAPGDVRRRACASAAGFSSAPSGSRVHSFGSSISATACSAASAWDRLHFAGLDADQMVPRPAGHGDRHGDHGLRRRRDDRLAAVGVADARVHDADPCRGRRDLRGAWDRLRLLHAGRRGDRAGAGAGVEARGLRSARPSPRNSSPPTTCTSTRR